MNGERHAACDLQVTVDVNLSESHRVVASGLKRIKTFSSNRALQDDAIQTALRAFGIDGDLGAAELQVSDDADSALAGVPVNEDTVVQYDARHIPGFEYVGGDITGRAMFKHDNARLEVFTSNRLPLEKVFGVDLIYLNLDKKNLVMVQYKMLESTRTESLTDWIYRPDGNLNAEIARMDKFVTIAQAPSKEYRLNSDPFYLKFVKRNGLLKNGSIMTPLAHFKHVVQLPAFRGKRHGIRISYDALAGAYMRSG
ncbi:MAG TPA: hypothetical protein VJQ82_28165, partial [Terriglobales bacterium]|nr:hypothetical protein [Terriglobales bacterium]